MKPKLPLSSALASRLKRLALQHWVQKVNGSGGREELEGPPPLSPCLVFHSISLSFVGYSAGNSEAGGERQQLRGHGEHGEHRHRQHAPQGDHPGPPQNSQLSNAAGGSVSGERCWFLTLFSNYNECKQRPYPFICWVKFT